MFKDLRVADKPGALPVVIVPAGAETLPGPLPKLATAARKRLADALATPGFGGDLGETLPVHDAGVLVGAGSTDTLGADVVRRLGGRLARALDRAAPKAIRLHLRPALRGRGLAADTAHAALGEGLALGNWRVDFFDGTATETPKPHPTLSIGVDAKDRAALQRGLRVGTSVNEARRLAATPPNLCHPPSLAAEARRMAKSTGLRCRVITYAQAQEQGMGGIVNVGRASTRKPCLIVLEHRPTRTAAAARGAHLVLVGKSITYDTGGYSLKISNGMKGMKYDKCGGMAVLGAMRAIADLKVPVRVTGLLPAAENMVAGDAYRPDDIIEMYNGVSVEVTNTDAEGRLVLADALAYACKRLKPTAVVDIATLTGGVVVALGSWSAGLWCNDDALRRRVETASTRTGERVWRLPLWEDHRTFMRSKHADLWNSGPRRDGHPIQGAAFLSYFVDESVPWAHLDIAGVASVDADDDLHVAGPTGWGVRLLTELAEGFAKKG